MKRMKKIASLLLAAALVLSLATTAFADTGKGTANNGKITITNTAKDAEYTLYRIFDLESFSDDGEGNAAYSYKVNSAWAEFFKDGAPGSSYVNIDSNGYVTWKENASAANFAAAAIDFAGKNKISQVGETKKASEDNETVEFSELPLGYYLVDSTLGALCALTTTKPEATVIEKNANPTLTKEVKEGETWGNKNDANVGDTVEFKATITVQGSATDYVMHDQMDDGLTYAGVQKVTLNGADVATSDYTVTFPAADNHTFDVTFTDPFCNTLKSGDEIIVSYTATLNSSAIVKEPENNNAHLSYKDKNGVTNETPDSKTETYTWEIPVWKYDGQDKSKALAGAIFSVYTAADTNDGSIVKFSDTTTANTYQVNKDGTITQITTDNTGRFKLDGLDAGTYYLKEIEAPNGYNKLNEAIVVTIDHDGNINSTADNVAGVSEVGVANNTGTELPTTGGIGTTIFYIVGGILVVGAVVLLIARRRMSADK